MAIQQERIHYSPAQLLEIVNHAVESGIFTAEKGAEFLINLLEAQEDETEVGPVQIVRAKNLVDTGRLKEGISAAELAHEVFVGCQKICGDFAGLNSPHGITSFLSLLEVTLKYMNKAGATNEGEELRKLKNQYQQLLKRDA